MCRWLIAVLLAWLTFAMIAGPVLAEQTSLLRVTATYVVVPGGYRYGFTVYDDTDPALGLNVVSLAIGTYSNVPPYVQLSDAQSTRVPWSSIISNGGGYSNVQWSANGIYEAGVAPGHLSSSFAFTSSAIPDRFVYLVGASNPAEQTGVSRSDELRPEPLPEPSTILALGVGMPGLAGAFRRRRRWRYDRHRFRESADRADGACRLGHTVRGGSDA